MDIQAGHWYALDGDSHKYGEVRAVAPVEGRKDLWWVRTDYEVPLRMFRNEFLHETVDPSPKSNGMERSTDMRKPEVPPDAEVIRTYAEYLEFVNGFFGGYYNLLVIVGRPGLGKSFEFEQGLGDTSHLVKGKSSPLKAYMLTYYHRNKLLIYDDAELLWRSPDGRHLIRSITEHKSRKLVQWDSTVSALRKANPPVPTSFSTSSKVTIIANKFVFGRTDEYEAILDRGHLIYFDPTPVEVHKHTAAWFWDQQIFGFVGQRLNMIDKISARVYLKAWERKKAGGDWKKLIEQKHCRDAALMTVQALETDHACRTGKDRERRFIETTGMSRATYYNYKRELDANGQLQFDPTEVTGLEPKGTPPEEVDLAAEVAAAQDEDGELEDGEDEDYRPFP